MGNQTVKARLLQTLALVSALMVAGDAMGLLNGYHTLVAIERIYRVDARGVELLMGIKADTLDVVATYSSLASFSSADRSALLESVDDDVKQIDAARNAYLTLADNGEHRREQAAFVQSLGKLRSSLDEMHAKQSVMDPTSLGREMAKSLDTYAAFQESIAKLIDIRKKDAEGRFLGARLHVRRQLVLLTLISMCGLTVAWISYFSLSRKVIRPLAEAAENCERIASGDLCAIGAKSMQGGEIGRLFDAFHHMEGRLNAIVGAVRRGSESVANASVQIAMGNADLSQRTERQVAGLQAIVEDLRELATRVERNSNRAGTALEVISDVATITISGREEMTKVVSIMHRIVQGSLRMNEIIGTIESLSFQTNILALNAAVESARAGEHGRGFAVVASEVRNLAQRSAAAAREISDLIHHSSSEIGQGSELVNVAGRQMDRIAEAIGGASELMKEIAAVSTEQSDDINRTQSALGKIEQTTLQNATLVEEASAAASELQTQASQLASAMQFFTTREVPGI